MKYVVLLLCSFVMAMPVNAFGTPPIAYAWQDQEEGSVDETDDQDESEFSESGDEDSAKADSKDKKADEKK